ncbi:hypothetical protein [Acidithiobacillus thiooxidans]|uniref:hypothetical protein n=1 Tax=Acidithiobacillus thiooxidans TaxID=930 RepID=UPI0009DB0E0C|nr:hypothetical protein [Acidithiobacillus thiooxidans]
MKISKIAISALLAIFPAVAMATDTPKGDIYTVTVTNGNHALSGTLGTAPGKIYATFKGTTYHYSGMVGTLSNNISIKYPKSASKTNGKVTIHYGYLTTGTDVTIIADHGDIHVLYNKTRLVKMQTKNVDGMAIKLPDTMSNRDVDNVKIHNGGTENIPVGKGVVIHITRS